MIRKVLKEFKKFINRGNVIDLAVGVIIGGAFNKIVTSLVQDIITPLIGILIGGIDFTNLSIKIGEAEIKYGAFIQNIIDFLIVSFCIFVVIKFINNLSALRKEKDEKNTPPPAPAKKADDILLLEEIRDLLKNEKDKKN